MKAIYKYLTSLALLSSLTLSCERQELCDWSAQSNRATIRFSIDWEQSGIDKNYLNNVSIYGYPDDGGDPYLAVSGEAESASIYLPVGNYSLLIFNDVVGDIEGVSFKDVNSYDNIRTVATERSTTSDLYYTLKDDETVIDDHEAIAGWWMEGLVVTEEMVSCGYCEEEVVINQEVLIDVTTSPITTPCEVTMRIENLNNASIIQAVIRGLANGVYLVSEQRIAADDYINLYSISFTKRTYDSDGVNGIATAEITTFGKSPYDDQEYELEISVILNSGELMTFYRDVTEQVREQSNLKISISLESDENLIVLPESIGTGFGVESWGDRTTVELK